MANKYDTWERTGPIQLPIDTYQAAGLVNDGKTRESLAGISNTLQTFENITPFGADARAVYDDAINRLRTNVSEIAKMDLNTPEAQRRVKQAIGDRSIVNPLKNVMMDSMYAAQRKKEMDEYLKKNPEVNAVDYLSSFAKVGQEKGEMDKFDPNRFANMAPIAEYFDVGKRVEEGVSKLLEDETEVKRIVGATYQEDKKSGRYVAKVRNYVRNLMANDPQVKAQLSRNLKHQYYQANPYDLQDGASKVANGYRASIDELLTNTGTGIEQLKAMYVKEKNQTRKAQMKEAIDQNNKILEGYRQRYNYSKDTDDVLNQKMMMDAQLNGYDSLASLKTSHKESYNPMAIASFNADQAMRRQLQRQKHLKELLAPDNVPQLTTYDSRQQGEVTDDNLQGIISTIPSLRNVATFIGDHGEFQSASGLNSRQMDKATVAFSDAKGKTRFINQGSIVFEKDGKYYSQNGLKSPVEIKTLPLGYTKVGTSVFSDIESGKEIKYNALAKAGTVFSSDPHDAKMFTKNYEQGMSDLKSYLKSVGRSENDYGGLKTELDVRKALKDIATYHTYGQSAYLPMYEIPASYEGNVRQSVASQLPTSGLKDVNGNEIRDPKEIAKVQEYLLKNQVTIKYQPFTFGGETSDYSFSGPDGKVYKTPMPIEYQQMLSGSRTVGKEFLKGQGKAMIVGDDLIVGQMGENGLGVGMFIPDGGSAKYQAAARTIYNDQLHQIMAAGYKKETASQMLADNFIKATAYIQNTGQSYPLKLNNKTVYITNPTKESGGKIVATGQVLPDQRPIGSIGDFHKSTIERFSSPNTNPYMRLPLIDKLGNKQAYKILMSGGEDEFGAGVVDNSLFDE